MDTVASKDGSAAGRDPDTGQCVGVDLVLFDESLALFVNVDATMLAMVDLVVSNDRVRSGPNLYPGQRVAVNVVVLDEATPFTENVNASLMTVVNLVAPDSRVRLWCDPHPGEVIRMDSVVDELAAAWLMHVDAARLAVVDLAPHHGRVGTSLDLKAGDPVIVDVVSLEVAEPIVEGEDAHITTMVDVVAPHYRVGVVLHPHPRQCVPTYLVLFIDTVREVCHVETDILTVADIAVPDGGLCARPRHAHGRAHYRRAPDHAVVDRRPAILIDLKAVVFMVRHRWGHVWTELERNVAEVCIARALHESYGRLTVLLEHYVLGDVAGGWPEDMASHDSSY